MTLAQALTPELQMEAAATRKIFERLPESKWDWQPHEKSFKLGALAAHIAETVDWLPFTMNTSEIDFATMDYKPAEVNNVAELLALFDKNVAAALETLSKAKDEDFMQPWTMRNGDQVHFTMPKAAVVRSFVMNHLVHHRAQLGVYLRLNDVPLPAIYGPTADEKEMVPASAN